MLNGTTPKIQHRKWGPTEQILFLLGLQILEGASKNFGGFKANFFVDIASAQKFYTYSPKNKLFLDNILTKLTGHNENIFRFYIFVLSVSVGFLSLFNNNIWFFNKWKCCACSKFYIYVRTFEYEGQYWFLNFQYEAKAIVLIRFKHFLLT